MPTLPRVGGLLTQVASLCAAVCACSVRGPVSPALAQAFPVAAGERFRDARFAPELVVLPGGSYQMGSTIDAATRAGRRADLAAWETPRHGVRVTPIAVGRFLVTRKEYAAFVAATSRPRGAACTVLDSDKWQPEAQRSFSDPAFTQTDRDPAVCVAMEDALAYVQWLTKQTGHTYRLLREAEWEYAARAGTTTVRWWSDGAEALCAHANGADRSFDRAHPGSPPGTSDCDDHFAHTNPGDAFPPNAFGLHDMLGNVWQWTDDCFAPGYADAPVDASAPVRSGDCAQRVIRGGSWHNPPDALRSATRFSLPLALRSSSVGMRVVRLPDAQMAPAAEPTAPLVIFKRDRPLLTVFAWERSGNFINAVPGDGKEVPYDAAKLLYRLYAFPTGEIREIDFARGVRTHDHVNLTDTIQYTWTGRRVQFAQDQAEKTGPGDAAFHPKGVFHHGEALEAGKTIEFAFYVNETVAAPQANWLNTGTNPLQKAAAWRDGGIVREASGAAVARAPRAAATFALRSYDFGRYVTRELRIARGATIPIGTGREHLMYVLSGRLGYSIGDQRYELVAEDAARLPAGQSAHLDALEDSVIAETLFDPATVKRTGDGVAP